MKIGWWSSLNPIPRYSPLCYRKIAALQRELVLRKKAKLLHTDLILLLEHSPTYTVGRRGWSEYPDTENERIDQNIEVLLKTGAGFERSNRGGLITFHGPGQLIAYPILDLNLLRPEMKWYVNSLQQSMINLTKDIGIPEAIATDNVGVWLGQGQRKIASIGFHVDRWITSHGLSYNINIDLEWFKHIIPCGLKGKTVTSIINERSDLSINTSQAALMLLSCLEKQFKREIVPLNELDPCLYKEIEKYVSS